MLVCLILSISSGANRQLLTMVRISVTSLVAILIIAVTIQTVAGESHMYPVPICGPGINSVAICACVHRLSFISRSVVLGFSD